MHHVVSQPFYIGYYYPPGAAGGMDAYGAAGGRGRGRGMNGRGMPAMMYPSTIPGMAQPAVGQSSGLQVRVCVGVMSIA